MLVKQSIKNKLTPHFNPNPGTIIQKKGSMLTARYGGKTITRDVSHFKLVSDALAGQSQREARESENTAHEGTLQPRNLPHRDRKKPAIFKDCV